jgi:threonine/homoserine/homoserine lactone efflux protein
MEPIFFLEGLIIGVLITAPVGPVGILCLNRTLSGGRTAGFVSGLGAVTGDVFYAAVAAYGIRVITSFLSDNSIWFRFAGAVFLAGIGIRVILIRPESPEVHGKNRSLVEYYISSLIVTATNPVTVLVFGAVFAMLGLGEKGTGISHSSSMVAGITIGAAASWFILSSAVDILRERFRASVLSVFNRVSGALLVGFSFIVVLSIFQCRR